MKVFLGPRAYRLGVETAGGFGKGGEVDGGMASR